MSEPTKDRRDAIEQLLDRIEDTGDGWAVVDYDPTVDPYETLSVTVTVERTEPFETDVVNPDTDSRELGRAVLDRINTTDGAVHVEDVLGDVSDECGVSIAAVDDEIESLKQIGEVYEPKADELQTT